MNNKIFQIFYDCSSLASKDPGFIGLDNTQNSRPDWFEYWSIRNYFKSHPPVDGVYYGFLSPKFYEKTGLTSFEVFNFIEEADADIISFSPYFDQAAAFLNIFEQAEVNHRGMQECMDLFFNYINLPNGREQVMTSDEFVFCNFFVAKKNVWNAWIEVSEGIFDVSECGVGRFSDLLNSEVFYLRSNISAKIFIVERIISALILINKEWKIRSYNKLNLPFSQSLVSSRVGDLLSLEASKIAFRKTNMVEHLNNFYTIRQRMLDTLR